MKKIGSIALFMFTVGFANAQHKKTDTLYTTLKTANSDTARFVALENLCGYYYLAYPDSAIAFGQQEYEIADKHKWVDDMALSYNQIANAYATLADYVKGMQYYFLALGIYQNNNNLYGMATENNNIGATYIQKNDYKSALPYLHLSKSQMDRYGKSHAMSSRDRHLNAIILENLGEGFLNIRQIDSADYYLQRCFTASVKDNLEIINSIERDLGEVQSARGDKDGALKYFRKAVSLSVAIGDVEDLSIAYLSTAKLYHKIRLQDSAEYYAKKALESADAGKFEQDALNAGQVLYGYYDEDNNLPQAYKYFKITTAAKDSLYSQDKVKQLLSIDFDERQRQAGIANAQLAYKDRIRTYLFIAGLCILLLIVLIFWRNGLQRKKANRLLLQQKSDIENALEKLKLTQAQLIQSEKMASLGELTAGIAHEIQNPLNFINNFSEVNLELSVEMKEELKNGNFEDAIAIADDIEQNLEKVIHHGKRADGIVKGMLQHSRAGSNTKEETDINKLADEYFRLAYHGLRAKDKSFNSELVTNFDTNLPLIDVVPSDIGRALLNLFTNAFYAVHQKKQTAGNDYKPEVAVSTSVAKNQVIIKVKDNGNGIPDNVKEKIMQPFFTTKPTGEGTGLGLSLTYDIVVKGHGGAIDVETKEGEYTIFTVSIPA